MSGNRKLATEELLKWIEKLMPGSENTAYYKQTLEKMSDAEFESFMKRLESGEETLSIVAPNLNKSRLSVERNLKIAEELGHDFFERLILTNPTTGQEYQTPIKYMVIDLPLRRQQQLLIKKKSVATDNRHIDELTGQVTGDSHSSSLSAPEVQVLRAQGLDRSIEELLKFRGGDIKAFQAMDRAIVETGGASQDAIKAFRPTRVKSTQTLSILLKTAHIDNTL